MSPSNVIPTVHHMSNNCHLSANLQRKHVENICTSFHTCLLDKELDKNNHRLGRTSNSEVNEITAEVSYE